MQMKAFMIFIILSSFNNKIFKLVFEFNLIEYNLKNQIIIYLISLFIEIIIIKIIEKVFKLE